jgi:aryl-alcohol dehydrogenase-like predicted oxidoreductase
LIRAIGASNFPLPLLKQALELGWIDAIQPEYSLLQRDIEAGLLPFCAENSISVMSYSSIAKGILTGIYHLGGAKVKEDDFRATRRLFLPEHMEKERELIDAMKEIADRMGISMSQLAIAWLLHRKGLTSAIVGTQSEKHLLDNLKAAEVSLSGADITTLEDVSARVLKGIQ